MLDAQLPDTLARLILTEELSADTGAVGIRHSLVPGKVGKFSTAHRCASSP
jgi:hypothetical protein